MLSVLCPYLNDVGGQKVLFSGFRQVLFVPYVGFLKQNSVAKCEIIAKAGFKSSKRKTAPAFAKAVRQNKKSEAD
jgi:hypothetical protein